MYYGGGGGASKIIPRGEPIQYSGRGRDHQYFMPEEDAYYDEIDYGHEEDVYGEEDADFTASYDQRREVA